MINEHICYTENSSFYECCENSHSSVSAVDNYWWLRKESNGRETLSLSRENRPSVLFSGRTISDKTETTKGISPFFCKTNMSPYVWFRFDVSLSQQVESTNAKAVQITSEVCMNDLRWRVFNRIRCVQPSTHKSASRVSRTEPKSRRKQ